MAFPGEQSRWGLLFFFGRNVLNAIDTKPTPQGAGPHWAYWVRVAI